MTMKATYVEQTIQQDITHHIVINDPITTAIILITLLVFLVSK